jgi:hypothetical protein
MFMRGIVPAHRERRLDLDQAGVHATTSTLVHVVAVA